MAVVPTLVRQADAASSITVALACDIAVIDLSAEVGIDALTPTIWRWLEAAGMPRVVAVTGLGLATPDFDDLAAIAQRVLGEECLPVYLPVLDDGEVPVASLDLTRSVLTTTTDQRTAEVGHLSVTQGDLSALLSVLSATVDDETAAAQYLRELNSLGEVVGPSLIPTPETDRAGDLAAVVAEGLVAPVVAHTPDAAWVRDLPTWISPALPSERLVRRDEEAAPTQGWAAVVLTADDGLALTRSVFDSPMPGPAMITAVGTDAQGRPVPLRAWPTSLDAATPDVFAESDSPADLTLWSSAVTTQVGDTLAEGHIWLLPAHDPDE